MKRNKERIKKASDILKNAEYILIGVDENKDKTIAFDEDMMEVISTL
jgi:hypothetical protein